MSYGRCIDSTAAGLALAECDGSDSQGFIFGSEPNARPSSPFFIQHTSGKLVTVNKSSGLVSLAERSTDSNLVQRFKGSYNHDDFKGSNIVAYDAISNYIKYLNPENITRVESILQNPDANNAFFFTYCYGSIAC